MSEVIFKKRETGGWFPVNTLAPPAPQGSGEHKLVALIPEVYRDKRGDWTEDSEHENGNYSSRCCYCERTFVGHKRRVVCKLCATIREKEFELSKLRTQLAEAEVARDQALTLGAEQVLEIQELRQVVKEYRRRHRYCVPIGNDDDRCETCIKADALLEPKAKPTQQGDKE